MNVLLSVDEFEERIRTDFFRHWEASTWPTPPFTAAPSLAWDGIPFSPRTFNAQVNGFARFRFRHSDSEPHGLGKRGLVRMVGEVSIRVFEPADRGTDKIDIISERALDWLQGTFNYMQLREPGVEDEGPDGYGYQTADCTATVHYLSK